ncbi:hypothetical protein FF38_05194 [Lucilia cuprina]|uniref:Uncharacterized protein n=1 Tax=Lucilia cuprina TaxID=7375 RepID=A0A0L0C7M1_LUCCU|nr:hypothetical protein FF38_05194 [Lucilia cuprina]
MEIEDVENLFKKLDKQYTGELIIFKAGLREWRRNINLPFICEKETLSANSQILDWLEKISEKLSNSGYSDCPLSTQTSGDNSICGTSLTNLLRNTVKGKLVLTFNEKNNYLDSKNQKTLVHCIIEKYIGTRSKLTYAEMQQWSYAICDFDVAMSVRPADNDFNAQYSLYNTMISFIIMDNIFNARVFKWFKVLSKIISYVDMENVSFLINDLFSLLGIGSKVILEKELEEYIGIERMIRIVSSRYVTSILILVVMISQLFIN